MSDPFDAQTARGPAGPAAYRFTDPWWWTEVSCYAVGEALGHRHAADIGWTPPANVATGAILYHHHMVARVAHLHLLDTKAKAGFRREIHGMHENRIGPPSPLGPYRTRFEWALLPAIERLRYFPSLLGSPLIPLLDPVTFEGLLPQAEVDAIADASVFDAFGYHEGQSLVCTHAELSAGLGGAKERLPNLVVAINQMCAATPKSRVLLSVGAP